MDKACNPAVLSQSEAQDLLCIFYESCPHVVYSRGKADSVQRTACSHPSLRFVDRR